MKHIVTFLDFIIGGAILFGVYHSGVAVSYKVKELSVTSSVLLIVAYLLVVFIIVHLITRNRQGKG